MRTARARRAATPAAVPVAAAVAALVTLLGGCAEGTVRLSYRPETGATYRYETTVRSLTVTELGDQPPERVADTATLVVSHRVLEVAAGEPRVEVTVVRRGGPARTFVVRLDRVAQLRAIERIEGVPAEALGELGLSEIFPAGAVAPPPRPLLPGDRWNIDTEVVLPGLPDEARLVGRGRLVALDTVGGDEVARVAATARLPVSLESTVPSGQVRLEGVQVTEQTALHDLHDGAVREASATTVGRFDMTVSPPADEVATPVTGTLEIEVRSETRRVG